MLSFPRRSQPAKYGEDRFGPPTLERSGSEHRRAVTSPLPEEEGLGEKVELSLQERRRGRKKPFLMGKSDANECNDSSLSNCRVQLALSTKKEGMILEKKKNIKHTMMINNFNDIKVAVTSTGTIPVWIL